ncbi:MAG: aminoacyl-tRNA hydrolase [Planctomycetes bacterium]|nr:aminoacyl-tRNA hydrolase [Planctomycetota bacterium]
MDSASNGLYVCPGVILPESEIHTSALRAGGPGGQNVNKVSSGVMLRFGLRSSTALSPAQRARACERLASRLTKDGELVLRAVEHREHGRNLEAARERLARLLAEALRVLPPRRATKPTRGSQRRRLADKRHAAERKASRGPRGGAGE